MQGTELPEFKGEVIKQIVGLEKHSEEVIFHMESGLSIKMVHHQDCCEDVEIDDFEGDPEDFIGATVLFAEEVVNRDEVQKHEYDESWTWTFYKIETTKGGLWIRWYGTSNGYYSESVEINVNK